MKISRHGASAFHGTSRIYLKKTSTTWNEKEKTIEIKSTGVKDFNTDSKHNYTISIPLEEIAKIFNTLGNDGVFKSAAELEGALEGELKALHRVFATASGLNAMPK